jgi:hypothetical protein
MRSTHHCLLQADVKQVEPKVTLAPQKWNKPSQVELNCQGAWARSNTTCAYCGCPGHPHCNCPPLVLDAIAIAGLDLVVLVKDCARGSPRSSGSHRGRPGRGCSHSWARCVPGLGAVVVAILVWARTVARLPLCMAFPCFNWRRYRQHLGLDGAQLGVVMMQTRRYVSLGSEQMRGVASARCAVGKAGRTKTKVTDGGVRKRGWGSRV